MAEGGKSHNGQRLSYWALQKIYPKERLRSTSRDFGYPARTKAKEKN
jgi:hypothetical protein